MSNLYLIKWTQNVQMTYNLLIIIEVCCMVMNDRQQIEKCHETYCSQMRVFTDIKNRMTNPYWCRVLVFARDICIVTFNIFLTTCTVRIRISSQPLCTVKTIHSQFHTQELCTALPFFYVYATELIGVHIWYRRCHWPLFRFYKSPWFIYVASPKIDNANCAHV